VHNHRRWKGRRQPEEDYTGGGAHNREKLEGLWQLAGVR
jgi:hypothetical protein